MTKKDFIAIAKILNMQLLVSDEMANKEAVMVVAIRLANYFEDNYPRFNRDTFLDAVKENE